MKPKHFEIAELFLGMDERNNTKELDSYFKKHTKWPYSVKSTPWCAAFVNATLAAAGLPMTGSFMARSFLKYGRPVTRPNVGDIVVFKRGAPPSGHVAYYVKNYDHSYIVVLGGNQKDEVCMKLYRKDSILGYRRP